MAEITIIPAKERTDEIIRTAAYARVSSDSQDQLNSFAAQIRYYIELLKNSTAVREVKTLGISVYFEKENIDTAEVSSEMMLAIYSQFAQEESMSISKNVRIGVHKRMADGTYKTASTPF